MRKKDEARFDRRRVDRLMLLAETADGASARLEARGTWPDMIRVRRRFVHRAATLSSLRASDRRLPVPQDRPPATRIMSPRGVALRFYLIALCEAQLRVRKGMRPVNALPLRAGGDETGWIDLIAVPAERHSGKVYVSVADKKQRMIQSALRRLSREEFNLVFLPNYDKRVGRYEGFMLLDEGGTRPDAVPIEYSVPAENEPCVRLPVGLFRNGWIHFLEDAEIAFILMLSNQTRWSSPGDLLRVGSDTRIRNYGLGRDAYSSHEMLRKFGLIEVETEADRKGFGERKYLGGMEPHKFRLISSGFNQVASEVIREKMSLLHISKLANSLSCRACAARRSGISPAQPGGTRREVPGSDGLPGRETGRGQ